MFSSLGWPEFAVLVVIGLFVLGPERLPQVVGDLARTVRKMRHAVASAGAELREELALDQLTRDVRRDFGLDDTGTDTGADTGGAPVTRADQTPRTTGG